MRPSYQTLIGGAGVPVRGQWVPLSYNVLSFNACISGITWPAAASLTWELLYTFDDPVFERPIAGATQAGTTITVTDPGGTMLNSTQMGPGGAAGHGLAVGDCAILKGCGSGMDGTYDVASVTSNTVYTVTSAISQTAVANAVARVTPLRVWLHPQLQAITGARVFSPICISLQPSICPTIVMAVRPVITVWTAGNLDFAVLHAGMGT